jgi:hypothetical protein
LLTLAIVLQFWNEGRTLKRDAALAEGRADVVAVSADGPLAANDGSLVHVSGIAAAGSALTDNAFGVSAPVLGLRRRVEMFQWREKKQRKEEKLGGGSTREVVTYRYETAWLDDAIDSSDFREPEAHANPGALPFSSESHRAEQIRIGGFLLSSSAASEIGGWRQLPADQVQLPPNLAASFRATDKWLTTSSDPSSPQVGDVRVRFDVIPEGPVSIVARQQDGVLTEHATSGGAALLLVDAGEHSANAMFDAAASSNSGFAWMLRLGGFVLGWIGFGLLLKPLVVLSDVMPVLGRLAGIGVGIVSGLLSAAMSIFAISLGWIWYRPWVLVLVVLAIVALVFWLMRRPGPTVPPAAPRASPPPPPPPPPQRS